ncbi:hypothetical protein L1D14_10500 [Vibrio tubiashii]|uniref:hypothetical protein n=1 Tax=Vibrio tubiashii TaxID=29498 RepID=UPI001EFCDB7F|nr:hypothetical protein [Vibrio tubiashii]MCG9576667.1 hypothetical protein [Vibrio tubiashii]
MLIPRIAILLCSFLTTYSSLGIANDSSSGVIQNLTQSDTFSSAGNNSRFSVTTRTFYSGSTTHISIGYHHYCSLTALYKSTAGAALVAVEVYHAGSPTPEGKRHWYFRNNHTFSTTPFNIKVSCFSF